MGKKESYPEANIIYADCSEYKQMLDERNVKSMVTIRNYYEVGDDDSIIEKKRLWVYEDNRNDKNDERSYEQYHLEVGRNFSFGILSITGNLYKFTRNGEPYYKVYFEWVTTYDVEWLEGGIIDVYIDVPNNIMVMHPDYMYYDSYLIGYIDFKEDGVLF